MLTAVTRIMSAWVLFILSLSFSSSWSQTSIQGIKLVGSSNTYAGNLRILYNGTWGTICDNSWSVNDAKVACRMLGFSGAVCATTNARYGRASSTAPIWMSALGCNGREEYLDECPFYGFGPDNHYCTSHSDDAGAVCVNASLIGVPEVSVANTTSRSITITWPDVIVPNTGFYRRRYIIQYNTTGYSPRLRYTSYTYYSTPRNNTVTTSISNLLRNRVYSISVQSQVSVYCGSYYSYISGQYSEPTIVSTSATAPTSKFGIRLVSPIAGLDFLGRVEVYHNGVWGTVCDNSFDLTDANVICNMLNFSSAVCAVTNARLGRGSGKIWLNRLICSSSAEILDDCSYTTSIYSYSYYYSYSYCRSSHADDAGVICRPQDPASFAPAPLGFNGNTTSSNSIQFSWRRYTTPRYASITWRLVIAYTRSDRPGRTYNIYPGSTYYTSYTLRYVTAGVTFNATIRVKGRFYNYYCYTYLDGATSDSVSITTVERPPSRPPLNFHIAVVNCSAIHAEWRLPSFSSRNGIIRGYKLMYKTRNGEEEVLDLPANVTEYLIGNLASSTVYEVSVLAYTVGDSPRSIFLTATTNDENICQTDVIDFFGINGNDDRDKLAVSYYSSLTVFCGSKLPNVKIDWLFSNGTKVGIANRNVREGHYANGTTILQVGRFGRISLCDADTYICRANQTTTGRAQQKTFTMTYGSVPPTPGRPIVLNITSTTATVTLSRPACDGNHVIQYYNIRYARNYYRYYYYYSRSYSFINYIDTRLKNFTITGLTPQTNYIISVRIQGKDNGFSGYSSSAPTTTLRPVPSPPRAVSVELVAPNIISVRWFRPPVVRGRLLYYTVYAKPLISQLPPTIRNKRQAESLQTISKNFTSSITSGNLTLPQLGVEYRVQVRATTLDGVIYRHSDLSTLTPNATIFVPIQGLPSPKNVRVLSSTNTSITLSWTVPPTNDTITGYIVQYTATIEGKSPLGNLIRYTHAGNKTAPANANRIELDPLLPDTSYLFRVAVLTARGEGMQVETRGNTNMGASQFEKYVYLHVRFGPVFNCPTFRQDIDGRQEIVRKQIYNFLKASCNCGLTEQHINSGLYSCGQQPYQVIYRTQIMGTRDYSAANLVGILQTWIASGKAYIVINPFQMILDPTCPTRLDMLNDPECPVVPVDPHTGPAPIIYTKPKGKTESPTGKVQPPQGNIGNGPQASTVGGFLVGAAIIILLLIIIILIIGIVLRKVRGKRNISRTRDGTNVFTGSSDVRFEQFDNSDNLTEKDVDEKLQNL